MTTHTSVGTPVEIIAVSDTIADVLEVHVLSLDNDGAAIQFRLLGQGQRRNGNGIRLARAVGITRTIDSDIHTAAVRHYDGIRLAVSTIVLHRLVLIDVLVEGMTLICHRRLSLTAGQDDGIRTNGGRVVSVVVQIELDMVLELADDTTRQLVILQHHRLAGVVLQGYNSLGTCFLVEVGVRSIGHQLVAIAVDIEIA